jgi:glycerophosphoryl diester phosphodiesterase
MASFYLDRPLNFAHRGASYEAPQNTLAAFMLAADLGADGIEFDVHLSKDGQVVVIHDFSLGATTDGRGLVRAKTLAELKELDAGSHFDPAFAGERIPTLQEVIDTVGQRLLFNIELKAKGSGGDLAAAVVRIVAENNLADRVVVSSFNQPAVSRVARLNNKISTGLLYGHGMPFFLRRLWLSALVRPDALHPYYKAVDGEYMRWAKKQGYRVNVWTVDDPGEMRQLVKLRVDTIITNRPDLLREVLQSGHGGVPDPDLPAALRRR